jgi:4-diphosphocytidyl-2C-methyl-D-erythritol kinase
VFDRIGGGEATGIHHNDLELAACDLQPGLASRLEAMRAAAGVAFISGSGPTVVGVVAGQAEAEAVAGSVAPAFDEVLIASPSEWGVRLSLGS